MVGVAQVVEPQVVALVVVGSSPITHPIYKYLTGQGNCPVICFRLNSIYLVENKLIFELSQIPDSVFWLLSAAAKPSDEVYWNFSYYLKSN